MKIQTTNKYNLNETELQFIANIYFTGKSSIVNEEGELESLDKDIAKEILDFHGITGWDDKENKYIRILNA